MTAPDPIPPVKPVIKKKWTLYKKWQIFAPTGLIMTALGLALFGFATDLLHQNTSLVKWLLAGLLSLGIFVAGLVLYGEGLRSRILFDIRKKKRRNKRRSLPRPNPRPEK